MDRAVQLSLPGGDAGFCGESEFELPIDRHFPTEQADELARLESFNKHLYRPNTYLHKWWARRSGTTFRQILKQLVTEPDKRDFYAPGGLEGSVILDPMMGGGTTLHEAIRMGANCIGVDIDPIPALQTRASLRFQPLPAKRRVFQDFEENLREHLGRFFKTHCPHCDTSSELKYTLYALTRRCDCRTVGIMDSYVIREDHDQTIAICGSCHNIIIAGALDHHVCQPLPEGSGGLPVIERSQRSCASCGSTFKNRHDIPFRLRYVPLVVIGNCELHGSFYKRVDQRDTGLIREADDLFTRTDALDPAQFLVPDGPKSKDLIVHGVGNYLDLFTRRQLLFLQRAIESVGSVPDDHRLWLGLLASTSLEFNSLLCGYKGAGIRRPGAIRHVFSHHAYSFPYTALENNPIFSGHTSGTLGRLFRDRIAKAAQWASLPTERRIKGGKASVVPIPGEVDSGQEVCSIAGLAQGTRRCHIIQQDFRLCDIPEAFADFVVTDPPYYDSVQYSDLSRFFRVWLHQLLPGVADWTYDPRSAAVAEDSSKGPAYGDALGLIWEKCHRALKKPQGRLIFTFHHWSPNAWAELTLSLKRAGFALNNRYVVFSENPISVHIRKLKALTHDCILVLEPRPTPEHHAVWPGISEVDSSDSYRFCLDCGSALGFFLQSKMTEPEIRRAWKDLLGAGDELFRAFRSNPEIPTRQEFEAALRTKLESSLGLTLG